MESDLATPDLHPVAYAILFWRRTHISDSVSALLPRYIGADAADKIAAEFKHRRRVIPAMTKFDPDNYRIVEQLTEAQVEQLHELVNQQWWGGTRTLQDVQKMVNNTSLILGLIESSSEQLIGSCRVLTDFTFRATVYDVMVAEQHQGQGHGRRLLDAVAEHPELTLVSLISLACEPPMVSFYEQWDFHVHEGRTLWMTKAQRDE